MSSRKVDGAMTAMRPEKISVRKCWLEKLRKHSAKIKKDEILYLTLAGAEGHDIEMLIADGLLKRTETGAIENTGLPRVVAVESSIEAAGKLQEKYPGLKIIEKNIRDMVRGGGVMRWPDGEDAQCCRAAVVNLDLDEVLATTDGVSFPILDMVAKFIVLHEKTPSVKEWTLLLTVHAETNYWTPEAFAKIFAFLNENFSREAKFSADCLAFLGADLHGRIVNSQIEGMHLTNAEQQKLLMVFVPKRIAANIHGHGWHVRTAGNMRYGGTGTAPMATWLIDFEFSVAGKATPDKLYKEALLSVLPKSQYINDAGALVPEFGV